MKITKVDVWVLDAGEQRGARYPICCRVYTDEGIYGDGEAGVAYVTGYTAAYGMIIDMAHHIIGMDPMNTELIWETILKGTFWGQGGGVVVFSGMSSCWAASAVTSCAATQVSCSSAGPPRSAPGAPTRSMWTSSATPSARATTR